MLSYEEILSKYNYREGYSSLENNKEWLKINTINGKIKPLLERTLLEVKNTKDFRKLDFVLLVVQTEGIDFSASDNHFDLLFEIADLITDNYTDSNIDDKEPWLLHQLMDVSIHNAESVTSVIKRNQDLIHRVLRKVGAAKYTPLKYGPEMYFATYKSLTLFEDVSKKTREEVLKKVYLNHFDPRVVEDANEFIEYIEK